MKSTVILTILLISMTVTCNAHVNTSQTDFSTRSSIYIITPNGDGLNDTWFIENIWAYPKAEVIVFNRYGQVVFREIGYKNNWGGKYKNKELPDGTYYYVITHPSFDIVYKGTINIIRNR